ncbi:uncharacterized protein C21orf58 homolog [Grammomys surdaster]|uniref:uncharacterized protein C21orf58 homolog n=1 Tax=Grammomys surdaster TaxID=491861 RepID=UPI0010A01513|nr:uncharacterized protein C21orf58 homolog [Grammomys surdaster]
MTSDSSMVDQMTRLRLRLLEQMLEQERGSMDRAGQQETSDTALQRALRRRKDLLQRLWEQQLMDEHSPAHAWRTHGRASVPTPNPEVPPIDVFPAASAPLLRPPEPPRIIQHPVGRTLGGHMKKQIRITPPEDHNSFIIKSKDEQLKFQNRIQKPTSSHSYNPAVVTHLQSQCLGSRDMVEMMLMQNAQMHQILMQNMMLKALPPGSTGPRAATLQDQRWVHHGVPRAEKQKPPPVHHHHHYAPTTQLQAASTAGAPSGYAGWPPVVAASALPQAASFLPTVSHLTEPSTSHPSYP